MRWLKKSSDTPQLLGLSSLEAEDSLKKYRVFPEHQVDKKINDQFNQSIGKSRTGKIKIQSQFIERLNVSSYMR